MSETGSFFGWIAEAYQIADTNLAWSSGLRERSGGFPCSFGNGCLCGLGSGVLSDSSGGTGSGRLRTLATATASVATARAGDLLKRLVELG